MVWVHCLHRAHCRLRLQRFALPAASACRTCFALLPPQVEPYTCLSLEDLRPAMRIAAPGAAAPGGAVPALTCAGIAVGQCLELQVPGMRHGSFVPVIVVASGAPQRAADDGAEPEARGRSVEAALQRAQQRAQQPAPTSLQVVLGWLGEPPGLSGAHPLAALVGLFLSRRQPSPASQLQMASTSCNSPAAKSAMSAWPRPTPRCAACAAGVPPAGSGRCRRVRRRRWRHGAHAASAVRAPS